MEYNPLVDTAATYSLALPPAVGASLIALLYSFSSVSKSRWKGNFRISGEFYLQNYSLRGKSTRFDKPQDQRADVTHILMSNTSPSLDVGAADQKVR